MCGIAGIVGSSNKSASPSELEKLAQTMISTIIHRGPDAGGIWSDPRGRCALGHRRLSIIDTSDAGLQPMKSGDGRWVITFNGEIYNFQEIKPALEAAGIRLRGRTDTEVLIEAVAHWGTDALTRFDGMFAFAAFDTLTGEILMARDPFGEKPLYYMDRPGGGFAFASELQALERLPAFDGTIEIDTIAELLSFQYIGAPRSIYQNVRKLPPGHWLRRTADGRTTIGRYYHFRPGLNGFDTRPMPELADELEEILTRSIRRRLISDVPLGAFLSGGVDSSTVCALIRRKLQLPIMTFSTGFAGAPESEHLTARAFAQHLGTEHHEEILAPDAADFLLRIGDILDEPNGDSSCLPTYLLSRFARRHVTVAVSGDGGDEMFGGYGRYFATLDELHRHRSGELPDWTPGSTYFGSRILITEENHLADLLGFVPSGFAERVRKLRVELDDLQNGLLDEMRRTDVDNYMPGAVLAKVDRMSMRHALEVRTPFLNVELSRFAERLPDSVLVQNGRGKQILREVAYRYLPRQLIDLPKQGFGLPMSDWARTSLLDVAAKLIESDDSRLLAMLGAEGIGRFMKRQRTPGQFSPYQVWCVAMLESWLRHHPATLPAVAEFPGRAHKAAHLVATPVAHKTYLVFCQPAPKMPQDDIDAIFEFLAAAIPVGIGAATDLATLRFPEWSEPIDDDSRRKLSSLNGSTLLCFEKDTALNLDFRALLKLRDLGIARVIFRDAYTYDTYRSIDIRSNTLLQRLWATARVMPHAVAFIANQSWMKALGTQPFTSTDDQSNRTTIQLTDSIPDSELAVSVMMFEGARQLPPVRVGHDEIKIKGGGRYSIWNQQVLFAPTEQGRLRDRPYWLVPLNESTRPHLQFVPGEIDPRRKRELASREQTEKLLIDPTAQPFNLNPGDAIVICTHALSPGGAERQWVYLAQALSKAGYDVTFVVYHPLTGENAHYLPMLTDAGVRVMTASTIPVIEQIQVSARIPAAAALLSSNIVPERGKLMRLTAAFLRIAPKAMIAQLDEPNIIAGWAAHLCEVPRVVLSFRNYSPPNFPYIDKTWYRDAYRLLSRSHRVIFSGNHLDANRDYANWLGVPNERVVHVPNAIDMATFPTPAQKTIKQTRANLGLPADVPVLLGAFRLSEEKDPLTFIDVCALVIKEVPDVFVLLAGVGPMREQIAEKIANLGLGRQVLLLGSRRDINVLMALASVQLHTSIKEGMPNVLMEAQLMGIPVVATETTGTADVVKSGHTALLRPIGDAFGLAQACVELLRDTIRAARMGKAGRRHVLAQYALNLLSPRYIELLRGAPKGPDSLPPRDHDIIAPPIGVGVATVARGKVH